MSSHETQYLTILALSTAAAISLYLLLPFVTPGTRPRGPVIPGLRNWGNWCFCNSVLQSLASVPSFRTFLDRETSMHDAEKGEVSPLATAVRDMMHILDVEGAARVVSAGPLIAALESVQRSHISRAQQDAQEFLHVLLECLAAESNALPASVSLQQMATRAREEGRAYRPLPCEGSIRTRSTCTHCLRDLRAQAASPFLELTLLPPTQSRITLEECLARTLADERIDDYHCIHCRIATLKQGGTDTTLYEAALREDGDYELPASAGRSHVTLRRSMTLDVLPRILVLHINRSLFGGAYATRNSIDVTYSATLELQGVLYSLQSFVTHRGSHDRGHYVAYRRKSGKWYAVSDETVRIVDAQAAFAMGSSTFLIFYERMDEAEKQERRHKKRKKAKRRRESTAREHGEQALESVESKI